MGHGVAVYVAWCGTVQGGVAQVDVARCNLSGSCTGLAGWLVMKIEVSDEVCKYVYLHILSISCPKNKQPSYLGRTELIHPLVFRYAKVC